MKKFSIPLAFFCLSYTNSKVISNRGQLPIALTRDAALPKYKVKKLDSLNSVYLIYAEKNNQLYKIVTGKVDNQDCKNIKVSGEYGFLIESLFSPMIFGKGDTLWKRLDLVNAVQFNGTTIITESGCVNDLFRADNVEGLCIKY